MTLEFLKAVETKNIYSILQHGPGSNNTIYVAIYLQKQPKAEFICFAVKRRKGWDGILERTMVKLTLPGP